MIFLILNFGGENDWNLGKSLSFSGQMPPHLQNRGNSNFPGLLGTSNELTNEDALEVARYCPTVSTPNTI